MERTNEERFNQLFKQIMEIAVGNFEFRYKPSERLDSIDTLGALLNMLGEEIAYFNFDSYANFLVRPAPIVLMLDSKARLLNYSSCFLQILGYTTPPLEDELSINSYLTDYSIPLLYEELKSLSQEPSSRVFPLDFNTSDKRIFRSHCSLILLVKTLEPHYALVLYEDFKNDNLKTSPENLANTYKSVNTRNASTRVLVKNLRMYCLRNLHKPLPSLKEIGLIHRTNATKIKAEFKKAYGMTIYQFHLQERLEQAALLLETTDLPAKSIARKCGFNSAAHFTRCFKSKFEKTPLAFRKA